MLGLDDYSSSDDEDTKVTQADETNKTTLPTPAEPAVDTPIYGKEPTAPDQNTTAQPVETAPPAEAEAEAEAEPTPGPSLPPATENLFADTPAPGPAAPLSAQLGDPSGAVSAPQSPYSAGRAMVRNMTMPPAPNFDIPPSPPGSPPPKTTAQFAHFLEIKKKGVHFNERLENSSALRNPSLLHKLRGFAGIDDGAQYATTFPAEVAVPTTFPSWAYAEQLGKRQQEITKKREEEQKKTQRDALEFVPASGSGSSGLGVGDGKATTSMAERVRAGLSREGSGSPQVSDSGKRRDSDRRDRDYDDRRKRSRFRSRSRSPRRR